MTTNVKVATPKRKKSASLDKRKARGGWLFVMPFVLGFLLLYIPIIIDSIRYSFSLASYAPIAGAPMNFEFVGWANYSDALFKDPKFVTTLLQGLSDMIMDIPMILIFSLFMAVLLNQKMIGRAAFRAIFFIPVILSTGLMESIEGLNTLGQNMEGASGIDDGSGQSTAGDLVSTMETLIMGSPEIDFTFLHDMNGRVVELDTRQLRAVLGEEVSLDSYEVIQWIGQYLREQYESADEAE